MARSFCLLSVVCVLACLSTGCASMTLSSSKELPTDMAMDASNSYVVEMYKDFNDTKRFTGRVDDTLTIQRALEESGATEYFRGMDVEIVRRVPGNGQILKMPVQYQTRSKSVRPEQDYAVHAGDRIIVRTQTSNGFDKMIKTVFGNSL